MIGQRVGSLTVENAVKATLELWLPECVVREARRYAAEETFGVDTPTMEGKLRRKAFPWRPESIAVTTEFVDWLNKGLPAIQIISPSWKANGGDQNGRSRLYEIHVACVVEARKKDETRLIRAAYEDAIPSALLQHQSLGGVATSVIEIGGGSEQFSEASAQDQRTIQGSIFACEVLMLNVINPNDGPASSEPLPEEEGLPGEWPETPELDTLGVEVIDEEISE